MAKQSGPCAFSNACHFGGPRVRVPATNITYCAPHARTVQLTSYAGGSASLGSTQRVAGGLRSGIGRTPLVYSGVIARK